MPKQDLIKGGNTVSYKIAVASSDGANIDLTFGEAFEFTVYEAEGTDYKVLEKRKYE